MVARLAGPPADPRGAVRIFGFPSDGHVLHDGRVVADDDECAHDDARGMVEEHRGSNRRGGMNAHLKGIGRQALQQEREIGSALAPKPVGHAPGLQRDISLEVQKRRQKSGRRGVMSGNALQIPARRIDQIGRGLKRLTGDASELRAIRHALAEPFADLMGHCAAQVGVVEDRGR
jgi:hypothetical protein